MPLVYYLQIHNLATRPAARTSKPQSSQKWICKVNNKQMAFFQIFVSQQLLFLFSKHLDTMSKCRIVIPVKQIFAHRSLPGMNNTFLNKGFAAENEIWTCNHRIIILIWIYKIIGIHRAA